MEYETIRNFGHIHYLDYLEDGKKTRISRITSVFCCKFED